MTSLCVTDLLNILLVDGVPLPQEDDAAAEAEEAAPRKGAAIVLPPAGQPLSALAGAELSACADLKAQFRLLKRSYFALIRHVHPDKGGDAPTFRRVQDAFQHVRAIYDAAKIASFTDPTVLAQAVSSSDDVNADDEAGAAAAAGAGGNVQPWEFYEAAASADEPGVRVELAKSDRSRCSQTSAKYRRCAQVWEDKTDKKTGETKSTLVNPRIAKDEVRLGFYEDKTGSYGRWVHLECWRVPSKIWLGLPDGHLGSMNANEKQKAAAAEEAAARASTASSATASASKASDHDDSSSDEEDGDDADEAIVNSTKYKQYFKAIAEMNNVFLSGFGDLSKKVQKELVLHCMERGNWAQKYAKRKSKGATDNEEEDAKTKKKEPTGVAVPGLEGFINGFDMDEDDDKKPAAAAAASASPGADLLVAVARSVGEGEDGPTAALALKKEKFVKPVPGVGKGVIGALDGLRFVLTGVFPELGGGSGLGLGKSECTKIITSFGGTVTGSISGKTSYLLVGKEPGMSKVRKANEKGITRLNLDDLKKLCEGGSADDIKPVQITSFSKGFGNNGLAIEASAAELTAAAAANQPTQPMITDEAGAKKPAAKKSQGKAEAKKPAKKGSKTKKELKTETKAAATKKAAEDKAERKAKLAKANKLRSTPIEELDWQSYLEAGDLDNESVDFLKKILKHESLKVSGKKAELLARLREHAGLEDPMDEDEEEEEAEESDDEEEEEMDVEYDDVKPSASSSSSEEEAVNENYGYDMHYYEDDELKESAAALRSQFSAEIADEEAVV